MSRLAALAIALVLLGGVAHAQPRDVAKADALFREGRAAMKKGDFEAACPKLEESYRLDPAAGTGINLGDCFEKRGKVASALLAYEAARALLQPGDPRIGPVEKEIAALDKRAPRLTIKLAAGAPEGTTVKRDGREVGGEGLGLAVPVNPGQHWIVVVAPGRADSRTKVKLAEGGSRTLVVEAGEPHPTDSAEKGGVGASPAAARVGGAGESSVQLEESGSSQRTWGWVAVGGGAVALLAAGYFGLHANQKDDEAERICQNVNSCARANESNAATADANAARLNGNIALAIGLLAGAGGATLIITAPPGQARPADRSGSSGSYMIRYRGVW